MEIEARGTAHAQGRTLSTGKGGGGGGFAEAQSYTAPDMRNDLVRGNEQTHNKQEQHRYSVAANNKNNMRAPPFGELRE